jgi:hypothetical protein
MSGYLIWHDENQSGSISMSRAAQEGRGIRAVKALPDSRLALFPDGHLDRYPSPPRRGIIVLAKRLLS